MLYAKPMNSKIFLVTVAVIAAFGISAAVVGPVSVTTPALAQNMTGDMGGNMTGDNMTAGNMTDMGGTPTG